MNTRDMTCRSLLILGGCLVATVVPAGDKMRAPTVMPSGPETAGVVWHEDGAYASLDQAILPAVDGRAASAPVPGWPPVTLSSGAIAHGGPMAGDQAGMRFEMTPDLPPLP